MSTCTAQCAHLEIVLKRPVANQAAQGDAARDSRDARARNMSQLVNKAALWKRTGWLRPWLPRDRIPHMLGDSLADIQAFVGEPVNVTARGAAQLRSVSDYGVAQFKPPTDGSSEEWITITDGLEIVWLAFIGVLSVRLSPAADTHCPCLERLTPLSVAFTAASAGL
ncbi:MAG: hypothetical protein ABJF07_26550, partial [Nisaea sp.]|uniref:hypothetical protein n=1 Tax=Nisaea sp. TaxID=2024842 RepID=UPI003266D56A